MNQFVKAEKKRQAKNRKAERAFVDSQISPYQGAGHWAASVKSPQERERRAQSRKRSKYRRQHYPSAMDQKLLPYKIVGIILVVVLVTAMNIG